MPATINLLSFEESPGKAPPVAVSRVYRYFVLMTLWPMTVFCFILAVLSVIYVWATITGTLQANTKASWDAVYGVFIAFALATAIPALMGVAIRLKLRFVYVLLYVVSKAVNLRWVYIGPFWPDKYILDGEFSRWFEHSRN